MLDPAQVPADPCKGALVELGDGREQLDPSVLGHVLACHDQGEAVALVTIVGAGGSAPRGMGSLMAVKQDGTIFGTVGGGNLELFAIRHALDALQDGRARRLHYDFRGGSQQNVVKPCGGTTDFFVQPFLPTPHLIVFGAGHVGSELAPMARSCGFRVTVVDDRPEFAAAGRFPDIQVQCGPFVETIRSLPFGAATYAVVMTYGHLHDQAVLEACLERPWRYLGLMGSRAKVATLMANLGKTPAARDRLARVHMPIGLDVGGRAPAEIAVAILAEMLSVRYGHDAGARLSGAACQPEAEKLEGSTP